MRKEMEAEIRAQLALNQEAMQSWDEKVSPLTFSIVEGGGGWRVEKRLGKGQNLLSRFKIRTCS
jgi:hypothetical protein